MNKKKQITDFGKELIIDLHDCSPQFFTRESIKLYLITLCEKIDMQREDLHFWDYKGQEEEYKKAPDHLKGISVIQFIKTSNITIHTLDVLKRIYINIFSCKDFDHKRVIDFSKDWFEGKVKNKKVIRRK